MNWFERQLERLRSFNPLAVDAVLAAVLLIIGVVSVHAQDVRDGLVEPTALSLATIVLVTAPVLIRRRNPLLALSLASAGILLHVGSDWPEGSLPITVMLLTYTVAAWDTPRRAGFGLAVIYAVLLLLLLTDSPGLDAFGVLGNIAVFTVAWSVGIALRARRETLEARVREADERAKVERQSTARVLAEERLRIAQELHDVVAHSMSVIAVQAGVGAHVLTDRPEQARAALEAISATSRGTLTEMRRLLGVLRDSDGERSHAPAPGLDDVPKLVEDVRGAGVPVTLTVDGSNDCVNAGVELSAYRVVQEALTNVIKHAGASRVSIILTRRDGAVAAVVEDDGAGFDPAAPAEEGLGLVGMRERVGLVGGRLTVESSQDGGTTLLAEVPSR